MESVRVAFTVLSFLTFAGIVIWAFTNPGKRSAAAANADLIADDDRVGSLHTGERK
jgi:cbb3-type cytochrome oxidase subunit 3